MPRLHLAPSSRPSVAGLRRSIGAGVAALLLTLSRATCGAPPPAPPPPPAPARPPMQPAERRGVAVRALNERTLHRADFIRALSALDPQVALIASEPAFHDYTSAITAANTSLLDALFTGGTDAVDLKDVSSDDLLAVARRTTAAYVAATDAAAEELGTSGAMPDRSADDIQADLFRLLAARRYQMDLAPMAGEPTAAYDTLLDFEAARHRDAGIAAAAKRASANPGIEASLESAIGAFRDKGAELGRDVVNGVGAGAIACRILWGGQDSTPALDDLLQRSRRRADEWRDANAALAEAIERHLIAGGDARAAARWRLRSLAALSSSAIVVRSWGAAVADVAVLFGSSAGEVAAIRAVLEESVVTQVERAKATLAAYERWSKEIGQAGVHPFNAEPSEALLKAHQRQMATDAQVRQRVLDLISSPLLKEELSHVPTPESMETAPFWLQRMRQREQAAQQAAADDPPAGGDRR